MEDRRKNKRFDIRLNLAVTGLFNQDKDFIEVFKPDLEVVNLSKSGLGFLTEAVLPLGYYFNANVVLDKEKHFFTVLKIVRTVDQGGGVVLYGCEFVGLADILSTSVDEFVAQNNID
jgi:hypothetical protein